MARAVQGAQACRRAASLPGTPTAQLLGVAESGAAAAKGSGAAVGEGGQWWEQRAVQQSHGVAL